MLAEHIDDIDRKVCLECHRQFTGIVKACPHDGSSLVDIFQDPLIGTVLAGKYEIMSVVGTGGMGVVYKGRQHLMDRIVAIKMLRAQHVSDSMSVKRFQQEGKACCLLNHPHVITIYDFGVSPSGQPFMVMDFLQGVALSDIIKQDGQVGVERSIKILMQACEALDHAHRLGVVHRDLKPSNIMLIDYDGEKDFVKVVDFGVAKINSPNDVEAQRLTQVGEVCGSPVYMSPEQCMGYELDNRSDIYSMGVVMYETITGKLPLLGKTMVDTMSKHISEPPPPFSEARSDLYIPERLEAVIMKALAKDPQERHQTMDDLAKDLDMAIPRPGRSQVLRTTPLEEGKKASAGVGIASALSQMSILHWIVVSVIVIGCGFLAISMAQNKGTTAPANATAVPPVVRDSGAITPPVTQLKSPDTGTTASGTQSTPSTGTGQPDTATTGSVKEPKSPGSTDVTRPAVTAASGSGSESARPAPVRDKPKRVATIPRKTTPKRPSGSQASAPPPRASGGGSDPFAGLLKRRSY